MTHGIYVYYDVVAESFVQPVLAIVATDEAAMRDFVQLLNDPRFSKDRNIGDYNLLKLGQYDVMANRISHVYDDPVGRPLLTGVTVRSRLAERKRLEPAEEVV